MILHRLGQLALSLALPVLCLTTALPAPLAAQSPAEACQAILDSDRLPADGTDAFARVQSVLAIALDRDTALLADGLRGPTSDTALVDLCRAVPFPEGADTEAETLRVIVEYARLTELVSDPSWGERLRDPALADRLLSGVEPRLALRLAGAPAMTAAALNPDAARAACGAAPMSPVLRAGLAAVAAVDPQIGAAADPLATFCTLYPTVAAPGGLTEALARFGTLEAAEPGAVGALLSSAFAEWVVEEPAARLVRLVGSMPAVQTLVQEFLLTQPAPPAPPPPPPAAPVARPASCDRDPNAARFATFGPDEAALLAAARDVGPDLRALADLRVTEAELRADILGVLGDPIGDCLRDQIDALLDAPDSAAQVFRLNEAGVQGLAFVDAFSDSQPVAEALIGRLAPDRALLLDGTEAAIRRAIEERFEAEIETAAGIFAAAAEPLPPTIDLPAVGLPEPDPVELPDTFVVTEITDATLAASIENDAFVEALQTTQFAPALSREVLMGDVRRVLRPVAATEIASLVAADTNRIASLVEERWTMTPALADAILAIPELSEAFELPEEAAQDLLGLAYPNLRLMAEAFAAVDPPLPDALQDRALEISDQAVPDLDGVRLSGELAAPEHCGCVLRRKENALVYAFYPFWLAAPDPSETSGTAAEDPPDAANGDGDAEATEAAADPASPAPPPKVDFELIERLAFFGLEWTDTDEDGILALRFQQHWLDMRRDFVSSAHRHRTRADLAIRIAGWEDWNEAQIETVIATTDDMMAPFNRYDDLSLDEAARFLPTLFDRPQPDALTLIVDGYDGADAHPDADKLVALVQRIARPLAARGQRVNLAFDMDLSPARADAPILDDIRALLAVGASDTPTVENILIFLQRPTNDTGQEIRSRLEAGTFSTAESIEILRRILPVVPPGGHQFIYDPTATPPFGREDEYGQLIDDVVYFRDNLAGMGFWPVPDADNADHAAVATIVFDRWDLWRFPAELAELELRFDRVCAFACPNRFYLSAAAIVLALVMGALIWRSFYSGLADRIAFRYGTVWVGNAILLVLLVLLTSCDQFATLPPIFLAALVLTMTAALIFSTYQRARNGPKP